jgi:hypothetical protein
MKSNSGAKTRCASKFGRFDMMAGEFPRGNLNVLVARREVPLKFWNCFFKASHRLGK